MKHVATIIAAVAVAIGAMALAQPDEASAEPTVNLTELRTVDGFDYPVCAEEDCSDQPGQVGLWEDKDTGNWYLELGEEVTFLINDDTVR